MDITPLHTSGNDIFTGFAESRIGGRRENQDSFGASQTPYGFVITVCDGMGGGPGGKTASMIAVREIIAAMQNASSDETPQNVIIKAIRHANMVIIEAGKEQPALVGMGSTATVLLINEYAAYAAHVGDSRIYQFRGRHKIFRTFDHSMVFGLVRQGVITEEQARLSAQSNVITRALGIHPDVEVDVSCLPYERGDRFMLCTDGIHGTMPEPELIRLATSRKNVLGALTDDIATLIDNNGRNIGGRHDNLTLAIIETNINSQLKPTMSKNTKLTLMALAAVCLLSIILNLVQCSDGGKTTPPDITALENSIKNLKRELSDSTEKYKTRINALQKDKEDTINTLNHQLEDLKKAKEDTIRILNDTIRKRDERLKEINKLTH